MKCGRFNSDDIELGNASKACREARDPDGGIGVSR